MPPEVSRWTRPGTSSSPIGNDRIREVNHATGVITTVAGNGTAGYSGDNGPATAAELQHPGDVAVDSAGDLFIADCAQRPDPRGRQRRDCGDGSGTGFNGSNRDDAQRLGQHSGLWRNRHGHRDCRATQYRSPPEEP